MQDPHAVAGTSSDSPCNGLQLVKRGTPVFLTGRSMNEASEEYNNAHTFVPFLPLLIESVGGAHGQEWQHVFLVKWRQWT